jgi:hypothetical protein
LAKYYVFWKGENGQSNMGPFSKKSNAIESALISIRAKTSFGQKWMKHGKDSWINDDGDTMEIQND